MNWPGFVKRLILADGRINEVEADIIRRAILANKVIDRDEVELLIQLKREASFVHPRFDEFLYEVLRRVVLANGVISDGEARWLRGVIFSDRQAVGKEVGFVVQLKAEAKTVGAEFERLHQECTVLHDRDFFG